MAGATQDTSSSSSSSNVSVGSVEYYLTGRNVCDHLELTSLVETHITCTLDRYLPPFLMVFGLVSNVLVILVMRSRYFNSSSTSFYMVLNALTDSASLAVTLPAHYAYVNFPDSFESTRSFDPMCIFFNVFGWATSDMGILLTVAMTTERAIAIRYPLKAYKLCTVRRAKFVSLALTVFEMLKLLHMALKSVVVDSSVTSHLCDVDRSDAAYALFYENIWPWLHVGILTICYVMVAIGNVIIIAHIRRSNNPKVLRALGRKPVQQRPISSTGSSQTSRQTSIMLVVDSVCLVLFTLPFAVVILLTSRFNLLTSTEGGKNLAFSATFYLLYVNRCMNFFLYCISGSRFRMALRDLFSSDRRATSKNMDGARSNVYVNQSLRPSEDATEDEAVVRSDLTKVSRLDNTSDGNALCHTVFLISTTGLTNDANGSEEPVPRTTEFMCTQYDDVVGREDGSVSSRHTVHTDVGFSEHSVSRDKASCADSDLQSVCVSQTVHPYNPIIVFVEQPLDHSVNDQFSKDTDDARHSCVKTDHKKCQIGKGVHSESSEFEVFPVSPHRNKDKEELSTKPVSERTVSLLEGQRKPNMDHVVSNTSEIETTKITEDSVVLDCTKDSIVSGYRKDIHKDHNIARNVRMTPNSQTEAPTNEPTRSILTHWPGGSQAGVINWGFEADDDFDWLPDEPLTFL